MFSVSHVMVLVLLFLYKQMYKNEQKPYLKLWNKSKARSQWLRSHIAKNIYIYIYIYKIKLTLKMSLNQDFRVYDFVIMTIA